MYIVIDHLQSIIFFVAEKRVDDFLLFFSDNLSEVRNKVQQRKYYKVRKRKRWEV